MEENDHIVPLKSILGEQNQNKLYCCILDLVENGLCQSRFDAGEQQPNRQEVTQFLASWSKHSGLSAEECRTWLTSYALEMLSVISSSGPSQIRHSTKSNVNYIYRAEVPYECGCENNLFKARCEKNCALYGEMTEKQERRKQEEEEKWKKFQAEAERAALQQKAEKEKRKEEKEKRKEEKKLRAIANRKSAEKHWLETIGSVCKIALEHRQKGLTLQQTAHKLNDAGFRTSKGCLWTNQSTAIALKRYRTIIEDEPQKSLFSDKDLSKDS